MTTRQKFKAILYLLLFSAIFILLAFWLYFASLQIRDYQRLADLKLIQNEFNRYYSRYATFVVPECRVNEPVAICFSNFGSDIIRDPLDSGSYRYLVRSLTEDDYEVEFSLEAGIGGLSTGRYILTKNGVRQ